VNRFGCLNRSFYDVHVKHVNVLVGIRKKCSRFLRTKRDLLMVMCFLKPH